MGISPGNVASVIPPRLDDQVRKQRDLERTTRENAAATPNTLRAVTDVTAGGVLNGQSLAIIANATIGGNTTIGGAATITGTVTCGAIFPTGIYTTGFLTAVLGITSTGVRAATVSSAPAPIYVDSTGSFGLFTSSAQYKQDIAPFTVDTAGFLTLVPKQYRRIDAVEKLGAAAPVEVGLIAEEVNQFAPWAIFSDTDGAIQGIRYEQLVVALLAIVKEQDARLTKAGL